MSNRLTLLASTAFIATLSAANAQPQNMMFACEMGPCIYDSQNTIVGIANSYETLMRPISNKWYLLFADTNGLQNNTMWFYASSNCTGQPYVSYKGELPPIAWFDGTNIWGPEANHAVVSISSWSLQGPPNPTAAGACASYGPNYSFQQDVAFPDKIDTTSHGWHPPFKVQ